MCFEKQHSSTPGAGSPWNGYLKCSITANCHSVMNSTKSTLFRLYLVMCVCVCAHGMCTCLYTYINFPQGHCCSYFRGKQWVDALLSTDSEDAVWTAFCKTLCSWWREWAHCGQKTGGGKVNMLDGWAAAQQQSQQTGKIGQQKPHKVQQKQMRNAVLGTKQPHKCVQLRGSTRKQLSKKRPATPGRQEVKHGSAVHFCRNQGQLLSCISQKHSQQVQGNCYFSLFSTCEIALLQSTVSWFGLPSARKVFASQSKPSGGPPRWFWAWIR